MASCAPRVTSPRFPWKPGWKLCGGNLRKSWALPRLFRNNRSGNHQTGNRAFPWLPAGYQVAISVDTKRVDTSVFSPTLESMMSSCHSDNLRDFRRCQRNILVSAIRHAEMSVALGITMKRDIKKIGVRFYAERRGHALQLCHLCTASARPSAIAAPSASGPS